jgi:transcription initiation factor TFIIE subunit alpha
MTQSRQRTKDNDQTGPGKTPSQQDQAQKQERPVAGGKEWVPSLQDPVVRNYIKEYAGELGLELAELIQDHQPILGVDIVELHPEKASMVRRTLYKLEESHVAVYEKDTDRTGWETFTWYLTLNQVKYQINKMRQDALDHLEKRLEFESQTEFYACGSNHPRVDFEAAMEINFLCPICEAPMANVDNSDQIERLVREIHQLKKLVF